MRRLTAGLLGAAMSALILAYPGLGAAAPPIISDRLVPLDLVVESTTEPILLNGSVHIVTELRPVSQFEGEDVTFTSVQIHINLVGVTGTGVTTGTISRLRGSQSFDFLLDTDPSGDVMELVLIVLKQSRQENEQDLIQRLELIKLKTQLEFDNAGLLALVTFSFHGPCD